MINVERTRDSFKVFSNYGIMVTNNFKYVKRRRLGTYENSTSKLSIVTDRSYSTQAYLWFI